MKEVDWDDLKLFFHVASQRGLSGAAAITGISAPTIGRRMLALERMMGRALFVRSQQGYALAPDGHTLFDHVQSMRRTVADIARWHDEAFTLPIVSVAGEDHWLVGFVAENASAIRGPDDAFRLCCKRFTPDEDLTFRHGMIAMRAEPPANGNFAVRKSVTVRYAAYRPAGDDARADLPWISVGTESATSDPEKWVFRNREPQIHTWTNAPDIVEKLIAGGAGRGVLPVFIGDASADLVRDGEPIEELTHSLWLAVNDDDRQRPEVRTALDRLAALLKTNADLFAGQKAVRTRPAPALIAFPRS
ncbi:LysR family transcriptional regulator [Rhizobiaceae bacterium BDR2-2]|uniref:LysR family transcriptional regulator n=1 Tax=Ectorhizobium quercum TaxID=2965071 RepID=A0AAE3SVB3_9HYPH|nr:LysR family transcriptional regulator [Ectorhizobium quercum]MCX8997523.1 LysR family transcriptional regulator [Ectorhizobium quercum]